MAIIEQFTVEEILDIVEKKTSLRMSKAELARRIGVTKQYIGQIKNSPLPSKYIPLLEQNLGIEIKQEKKADCVDIDYYPEVFGSCGGGAFALSETKELISVPKSSFWEFSCLKKYSVINAIGDSMYPSIVDRDKLIIEHWENEQIKDNRVYVFCYKDEIFVKRLIKNIDEIIIKSDNPDPMYRPRYVGGEDMNNIIIVGQVVGLFRGFK